MDKWLKRIFWLFCGGLTITFGAGLLITAFFYLPITLIGMIFVVAMLSSGIGSIAIALGVIARAVKKA